MILSNETIELRSYLIEKDNSELKNIYLKWISNTATIELINSFSLYLKPDINFINESFIRFTSAECQGFFIYHKELDQYLGTVKLDKIDLYRRSAEIGIMIGESSEYGKKIGTQSINLLLAYGFDALGLNRIWGGTSEYNYPMINLFKSLSFREEGRFKSANYIAGEYSDNIYFCLLRDERGITHGTN